MNISYVTKSIATFNIITSFTYTVLAMNIDLKSCERTTHSIIVLHRDCEGVGSPVSTYGDHSSWRGRHRPASAGRDRASGHAHHSGPSVLPVAHLHGGPQQDVSALVGGHLAGAGLPIISHLHHDAATVEDVHLSSGSKPPGVT